tara:strand:+ start:556 stop:759 length:204 start_codon:yes stop_codon:yes gene_type:complete
LLVEVVLETTLLDIHLVIDQVVKVVVVLVHQLAVEHLVLPTWVEAAVALLITVLPQLVVLVVLDLLL